MKIKLEIVLELPDETPLVLDAYNESLRQLLFDAYVNYATVQHSMDAMQWCAKGKVGSENEDQGAKQIYLFHNTWAEICANATWKFEIGEN